MSETKGWKYSIKFTQSLTSGMIAFHGEYSFDDPDEYTKNTNHLLLMLKDQERIFKDGGYKVASTIPNNMKDLADKNKEKAKAK